MKGSPLLRALIAFCCIALAGIPLSKLTGVERAAEAVPPVDTASAKVTLRLTFSTRPNSFAILHLNQPVWESQATGAEVEKELEVPFPEEGVDLQVRVSWPAEVANGAVRMNLTDPQNVEHEKTVWGAGDMVEVVTFP